MDTRLADAGAGDAQLPIALGRHRAAPSSSHPACHRVAVPRPIDTRVSDSHGVVQKLNLPAEVAAKIHRENARRVLGLK